MDALDEVPSVNEGCEAMRITTDDRLLTPVCMGGTAIAGCNNPNECHLIFGERMSIEDPHHAYPVFINEETGKVECTYRIAKAPLIPVDPPPSREE